MRGATFTFTPPPPAERTISIGRKALREVLEDIRDQLLSHDINGGGKKFEMDTICDRHNRCGTAACIGGWASIFLVGFEGVVDHREKSIVRSLFDRLHKTHGKRLYDLFYEFDRTKNYNEPNVAATAIQRYLDGERTVWPNGTMPNVLRYKRVRTPRTGRKSAAKK